MIIISQSRKAKEKFPTHEILCPFAQKYETAENENKNNVQNNVVINNLKL